LDDCKLFADTEEPERRGFGGESDRHLTKQIPSVFEQNLRKAFSEKKIDFNLDIKLNYLMQIIALKMTENINVKRIFCLSFLRICYALSETLFFY